MRDDAGRQHADRGGHARRRAGPARTAASGTPAGAVTTRSATWRSRACRPVSASWVVPENSSVRAHRHREHERRHGRGDAARRGARGGGGEEAANRREPRDEAPGHERGEPRHERPSSATAATSTSATPSAAAIAVSWSRELQRHASAARGARQGDEPGEQPHAARSCAAPRPTPAARGSARRERGAASPAQAASSAQSTVANDRHDRRDDRRRRRSMPSGARPRSANASIIRVGERDAGEVGRRRGAPAPAGSPPSAASGGTCRGVAAIARSSAISRSRSWIASPSVAGDHEHGDDQREPAEHAAHGGQALDGVGVLDELRRAALAARVHGDARRGRACAPRPRASAVSAPGAGSSASASARPGWPDSRSASRSVTNTAACRSSGWRGAAMPTTVAGIGGLERAEPHTCADAQAAATGEPGVDRRALAGRAGARPAVSANGVSAALDQPCAKVG